jgi:hypothetical protein
MSNDSNDYPVTISVQLEGSSDIVEIEVGATLEFFEVGL